MWTDTQRNEVINHAMDLATNVDNFRIVLLLTMTKEGMLNVVQCKWDDATELEQLGMYRLMAADCEEQIIARWQDNTRPMSEEE